MSRRRYKNTAADNFFQDIVEIGSLLPWWITLPVALLLYFLIPFNTTMSGLPLLPANVVSALFVPLFQGVFKFMVPLALILGAILNILAKIKSHFLFNSLKNEGAHKLIQSLSWQDFEFLLSEWFKKQGYSTELTGGGGADGGIDIKLYKNGELHLVQCKHYKTWKVSVHVVRELYGVMAAEKAVGGYVVTSGHFTKEAHAFAKDTQIELIDGVKLEAILDSSSVQITEVSEVKPDVCPKCGSSLVERKGRFGKFYGCSTYPKCKFTRPIK